MQHLHITAHRWLCNQDRLSLYSSGSQPVGRDPCGGRL